MLFFTTTLDRRDGVGSKITEMKIARSSRFNLLKNHLIRISNSGGEKLRKF